MELRDGEEHRRRPRQLVYGDELDGRYIGGKSIPTASHRLHQEAGDAVVGVCGVRAPGCGGTTG